mmetsp:Transcript_35501/g.78762  ORF Transcript_35501/g.78762 Transcript_35501/m.78762 type:complete len:119 (-) Transcript_35501:443-799(-)|eukprot:CAMPEP_0202921452 /NCGR_PEP_ID=MMETSP1392-20130828/77404_1 /ASSEMBLY_ACC=CAM_ASM_000868 /TAXON_ID=225041 /ORGANISM="Chlamydomonas chlamydogama, Strain SAG 11-48b" /LENGTH=118 /DNA_ID=CAMNT_0049615023 /DNA_START=906 /DNA_END=1262 /DNA_ORIENTATION=+
MTEHGLNCSASQAYACTAAHELPCHINYLPDAAARGMQSIMRSHHGCRAGKGEALKKPELLQTAPSHMTGGSLSRALGLGTCRFCQRARYCGWDNSFGELRLAACAGGSDAAPPKSTK